MHRHVAATLKPPARNSPHLVSGSPAYPDAAGDQTSAVVLGENDLLPIVLRAVKPNGVGGVFTLTIPSNVKIWLDPEKIQEVTSTTEIEADSQITLYAEGVALGSGMLSVNWHNATVSKQNLDQVKLTTFFWSGPQNVPDFSIYGYRASGGMAGAGQSKWVTPHGGNTISTTDDPTGTEDSIDIRWGRGPNAGKAIYQAAPEYIWGLDVNVVGVRIGAGVFSTGQINDPLTPGLLNGSLLKFVSSGSEQNPGFSWSADVTLLGPRGIEFIQVGFIQNLTEYQNRGVYDDSGKVLTQQVSVPALDILDNTTISPWYGLPGRATFFDATNQPGGNHKVIRAADTPLNGPPLTFDQGGTVEAGDDIVDAFNLILTFQLDVAVATTDTFSIQDTDTYTRRATLDWQFNGSAKRVKQTPNYIVSFTGGANGAGNKLLTRGGWSPVTDGSRPNTSGPTANEQVRSAPFTIE